jgi:arylsulfatase A-like enzyme
MDIAPTICARFGIELPGVDGRAIPELSSRRHDALSTSTSHEVGS